VGERGTPWRAVGLGVTITVTHTAAVLGLGAAVLIAGQSVLPGSVVSLLTVAAGLLVVGLGIRLVRRRWRGAPAGHGHGHPRGGVLAVGFSAGLVPCPEALSVLLLAVGLNRAALGLVMIVAFSVGLAGVLVGLGLVLVTGARVLAGRTPGAGRARPAPPAGVRGRGDGARDGDGGRRCGAARRLIGRPQH
jgi:nickel/cobalt exporter